MTIGEIVKQGLYYARTCRSLWLFGFFVGITSGGSSGGGGNGGSGASAGIGAVRVSLDQIWPIAIAILLVVAACVVMRFVSEGALIEGIAKIRRGGTMSVSEGFRAGWAHWGVLLRIAVVYVAAVAGSLVLVAAPCVIALYTLGPLGAVAILVPSLVVAVPWIVTLYLVQAFASQIAVLENRHALDAIRKARLFIHGRLMHGLKLIVATVLGTLAIVGVGLLAIAPVALVLIALLRVLNGAAVIAAGAVVLVPVVTVLTAMVGTLRSSIWTIGYVTQTES